MQENKQFFKVPNDMTKESNLKPNDVLIYLYLKSHDNPEHQCFPALSTLAKESGASINTIRNSIKNLEDNGYIARKKIGKYYCYYFSDNKKFQPFSPEFLHNEKLSFKEKAYIAASQQFMFTDIEGYGKITFSKEQLAKLLNMSTDTIYRLDNSLENKDYLIKVNTKLRNQETGCLQQEKLFKLGQLGQAILWQIKENTEDIQQLKENDKAKDILIKQLISRIEKLEQANKLSEITIE